MRLMTPDGELNALLEEVGCETFSGTKPIRKPLVFPNQKNMPGKAFSSTNGDFVEYESLLERDWILIKDFDSRVTRILEQPFELEYQLGEKRAIHIPDLLIWRSGSIHACDVKPARRVNEPKFACQVEATKRACTLLGWGFELLTEPDPLFISNLRWLGGYRDVPADGTGEEARMLEHLALGPATLGELMADALEPLMAKPVLMHLLWTQEIEVDLKSPIDDDSVARRTK